MIRFKSGIGLALLLVIHAGMPAAAQGYPDKVVHLVVPFAAGGVVDAIARVLAAELTKGFGRAVIVDNRPGASGAIGTTDVARSAPDGYTLLMVFDSHAITPLLTNSVAYDPFKDFTPIALLMRAPIMAVASTSFPPNDINELVAYAKAHPGTVTFGSTGVGSSPHLAGEMFDRLVGVTMVHVPYKGGAPAQTDLVGGHLDMFWASTAFTKGVESTGRVKILGQASQKRSAAFPDAKTLTEQGIDGFYAYVWVGISAPANTPAPIVERIRAELIKATRDPQVAKMFNDQGFDVAVSTPQEFESFMHSEADRYGRVIKAIGLEPN
jgi:tripartite-type tricarboxylate transporter receptor subunit TctC